MQMIPLSSCHILSILYLPFFFFEHFLIVWLQKMLQAHCMYFLCQSRTTQSTIPPFLALFFWRVVLETKIWVLGMLVATGVTLLIGSQLTEQRHLCVTCVAHRH